MMPADAADPPPVPGQYMDVPNPPATFVFMLLT
jgi:hypothetical protein